MSQFFGQSVDRAVVLSPTMFSRPLIAIPTPLPIFPSAGLAPEVPVRFVPT